MNQILKHTTIFVLGWAVMACDPEIDAVPNPQPGEADFSTYVALGNSLTAGYADNALYREAQEKSYPAILAMQFSEVGGGEFKQPLVPEGNGVSGSGSGKLELAIIGGSPFPVPTTGDPNVFGTPVNGPGPYNNLGVPGAKAENLITPGYGSDQGNPFFARFASAPTTTVVADAIAQNPTFFTLWIGNNDVLGYATSGGEGETITDQADFGQAINGIVGALKQGNPAIGGAIANIVDITKIPFFNVVPWNAFALESQGQVDQLTAGFAAQIDPAVSSEVEKGAREQITFVVANQAVTDQVRTGVAQEVVTGFIFQREFEAAKVNGATDEEAEAEANTYLGSAEGQQELSETVMTVLSEEPPAELQPLVDQVDAAMETDDIQNTIEQKTEALIEALNNDMLPPEQADLLNAAIDSIYMTPETQAGIEAEVGNQIAQLKAAGFYPVFETGPNGFVVEVDLEVSPTGLKQITANEKMLLSFASIGEDEFNPEAGLVLVPDQYALDASEIAAIEEARTSFNNTLQTTATSSGFAFVDIADLFDQVANNPLIIDGTTYSVEFVTGNIFSLDGVHLTQAGYAIVANEFIKAINATYDSSVSPVSNFNQFTTVKLP